jgi:hypothetical protein
VHAHPRVVDKDLDSPEFVEAGRELFAILGQGKVSTDWHGMPGPPELIREPSQAALTPRHERDPVPNGGQLTRDLLPDPRRGTSDHSDRVK